MVVRVVFYVSRIEVWWLGNLCVGSRVFSVVKGGCGVVLLDFSMVVSLLWVVRMLLWVCLMMVLFSMFVEVWFKV